MSLSKPRVQYKTLTFAEKVAVIREVEKGVKKKYQIAKDYGIAPNTLSSFLKNKDKILSNFSSGNVKDRKRAREPDNPEVDECVLKWFKQARDKAIPLSGPLVQAKAEEFSACLGKSDFKASNGWLQGFKERNGITFKSLCGESGSVDQEAANVWKEDVLQMIESTPAKDIFNVDETGLFFKCTPNKTLAFKGETCSGGKNSKERVTLLVGANMDGSEKLPLLMIGKSANPRCFKNVKSKPLEYMSNKKAWMTAEIFEDWLRKLDKTFRKQNRNILLFIDNCTAHKSIPLMDSVKVIFLPPNMTSVVQPMDQGIIKNLKHFYRCLLVRNLLTDSFKNSQINVLDAARMCHNAWSQVTETTIANCFRKAGFIKNGVPAVVQEENLPPPEAWDDNIAGISFEEFVNLDENVEVCGELSDKDILSEVSNKMSAEDDNIEEDKEEEQAPIPSSTEALSHLSEFRRYIEGQTNVSETVFRSLNILENFAKLKKQNSCKQVDISKFFLNQNSL